MNEREIVDFKKLTNKEMLVVLAERQATTHDMLIGMDKKFDDQISKLKNEFEQEKMIGVDLRIENAKQNQKWLIVGGSILFILSLFGNYIIDSLVSHMK